MTGSEKRIWVVVSVVVVLVCVVAAFGTGTGDGGTTDDDVFLGEVDLAERAEIWRNQYRRMTPGDEPLVQNVGAWPAAWEEFGSHWGTAPATRDLATWLVPFSAERTGSATVIRDAGGTILWSGTTDFAQDESANVTLTGWLASEDDWPLYEAARATLTHRLNSPAPRLRDGEGGGGDPNEPDLPGLRFVSALADFTNTPPEFRVGLTWTNTGTVDVFAYGPLHVAETNEVTITNDENAVVTVTNVSWHSVEPSLSGFDNAWTWAGTLGVTNSETNVFVDTSFTEDRAKVRFYAAAPVADTDSDGLNDGFEIFVSHSDPDSQDGDGDGLPDYDEYWTYHTNPSSGDSDHDGLNDATELALNLDPNDPDMDNDGLKDGQEVALGSDPENPDSDHDGLPDGWEVQNGLSPTLATGSNGADGDPDNDGFPNSLEFLLGGGAMNPAWSGEQLAYRLCHLQNGENQPGLRVDIEDAKNCGGVNDTHQNVVATLSVPALMGCGYYIDLAVEGRVENQNSGYDKVSFEAAETTDYFEGNNNLRGCEMVTKCATNQVLVFPNSQVRLRYDTVGHKFHTGAYAKVVDATVAVSYDMEVEGADFLCIGNTAPMTVAVADGGPFSWSVTGEAATISADGVLTAVTTGVAVVTASNPQGCSASKEVKVVQLIGVETYCPSLPASGSFGVNPEFFEGGKTYFGEPDRNPPYWWLPGTYANPSSRVFKVFYKYTQNATMPGESFAIFLYADLSEYGLPEDCTAFEWSLLEGPENSGHFAETNGLAVRFLDPVKGGLYKFRLKVGVPGGTPLLSDAWVLLPKAGGEISGWLSNEVPVAIQRAQAWSNAVVAEAQSYGEDPEDFLETAWVKIASEFFDYQGVAGTPTQRYSFTDADRPANHQPDSSIPGMGGDKGNGDWDEPSYATLKGVVLHRAKINNLLYAVWGRTLGYGELALTHGAHWNAIQNRHLLDNNTSQHAIELGCNLYDAHIQNTDLDAMLTQTRCMGLQTSDTSSGLNDVNLWPDPIPVSSGSSFYFPNMPTDYDILIEPVNPR